MKRRTGLLALLILCVLFAGCQKQADTTEPTDTTTSYTLTHVESGIISYSADEFQATGTLDLCSDGTARLYYGDQVTQLLYDAENMWTADAEDQLHPYSISGLVLTLDYYSETLTFLQNGETITSLQ